MTIPICPFLFQWKIRDDQLNGCLGRMGVFLTLPDYSHSHFIPGLNQRERGRNDKGRMREREEGKERKSKSQTCL